MPLIVILVLFSIWLMFGKNGYFDLYHLKQTQKEIHEKNQQLMMENEMLKRRIERLKKDPAYLKAIIREVMGLTEKNEIVIFVKP